MGIGIAGVGAHEEDEWFGRRMRIGGAVVEPHAHIGRCAVTRLDPDTGTPDLDTLGAIKHYRGEIQSEEPLPFGVQARVVEPGPVAIGDPVELLELARARIAGSVRGRPVERSRAVSASRRRVLVLAVVGRAVSSPRSSAIVLVTGGGSSSTQGSLTAELQRHSVTLEGVVPSEAVKSEIGARAAELVGGSANVTNNIEVDAGVAAGPWLEATIGAFAGLPTAPRPLRYSVADGTLTLEGKAASASEKSALLETVRGLVEGRLAVDDQVVVSG